MRNLLITMPLPQSLPSRPAAAPGRMLALCLGCLALFPLVLPAPLRAQTPPTVEEAPAPAPSPTPAAPAATAPASAPSTTDPAKLQEFQRRFGEGKALFDQQKYADARAIFDGILAEEPKAKGSLFYGGLSSLMLGESQKAIDYLERFRALDAKDPRPVVHLIQAYQALKRSLKVEGLRRELYAMRKKLLAENPDRDQWDLGRPDIRVLLDPMFVRERIRMQGGVAMEISEAFNYNESPHAVYMAQILDKDGKVTRNIYISYDPDQTAAMRKEHAKDPKYKSAEVFVYSEIFTKNDETDHIDVYRIEVESPNYDGSRRWILEMLARPPKPIMTIAGETLRSAAEKSRPSAAPGMAPSAPGSTTPPPPQSNIAAPPGETVPVTPSPAPAPNPASTPAPAAPGTKKPVKAKP